MGLTAWQEARSAVVVDTYRCAVYDGVSEDDNSKYEADDGPNSKTPQLSVV